MENSEWMHEPTRSAIQGIHHKSEYICIHSMCFPLFWIHSTSQALSKMPTSNRTITTTISFQMIVLFACSRQNEERWGAELTCAVERTENQFGDQTYWNSLWSKQHRSSWELSSRSEANRAGCEWVVHRSASQWNQNHSLGQSSTKQFRFETDDATACNRLFYQQLGPILRNEAQTVRHNIFMKWMHMHLVMHSLFGSVVIAQNLNLSIFSEHCAHSCSIFEIEMKKELKINESSFYRFNCDCIAFAY